MSEHLNSQSFSNSLSRVWPVSDFAKRYRLQSDEEKRLVSLFGEFATEHELLMNADRTPRWR